MEFQERLKTLRKQAQLTQVDVAEKLGISQPAYASWERGIKKPTQENLVKIAQILNVSVDYLVGNSDYTEDKLDNIELLFRMNSKGLTDEEKEIFKKELIEFMKERKKLFNGKEQYINRIAAFSFESFNHFIILVGKKYGIKNKIIYITTFI